MRWVLVLFLMGIFLSSPASAITCKNDYSSATGCAANVYAAGDCETLGFSKNDVPNCKSYLNCPFDTTYKRCVAKDDTVSCPDGYSSSITSQNDCLSTDGCSVAVLSGNNNKCGKCVVLDCGTGYFCEKDACEAKTTSGCSSDKTAALKLSPSDPFYRADHKGTLVNCWKPSQTIEGNPCCQRLGLTSGTVYDCVSIYPDTNGNYSFSCRTSPLAGFKCNSSSCGNATVACTTGYARSAANCGLQGAEAWSLGTETDTFGCLKCLAKACPAGSGLVYTDCHEQFGTSYGISQKITGYSGNATCKQCLPANCKVYGSDLYTYAQISEVILTVFGERYTAYLSNSQKETANSGFCYWGESSCGSAHSFVIQQCSSGDTACLNTAQTNWDRCIQELKDL